MWRRTENPPAVTGEIDVRKLGVADTDAVTAINVAAWGAWSMPVSMAAWFGATVGRDGVQHYGAFDEGRLVATGALFVGDGVGWLGFDATHPRYQGRKLRQAISTARLHRRRPAGVPGRPCRERAARPAPGPWTTAGSCSTRRRTSPRRTPPTE